MAPLSPPPGSANGNFPLNNTFNLQQGALCVRAIIEISETLLTCFHRIKHGTSL